MQATETLVSRFPWSGFWEGRVPCWKMLRCPRPLRDLCPAFKHLEFPCWEIEGTYCKWSEWGTLGRDTSTCLICQVYLRYGKGQQIELKLQGLGIKLIIDRR